MSQSAYIVDVDHDTFASVVLESSYRVPVLVDFWAAWCQPCQILMPLLKRLAEENQGAFILAKLNTDQDPALATQFGVRGLPTVKVFRNGEVVDELVGVQGESAYRSVIERYRTKPSDLLLKQAEVAWSEGRAEQSLTLLRKAQSLEPENPDVILALAEKLIANDERESARTLLGGLAPELRDEQPASGLLARLAFADTAKDAPNATALEASLGDDPNDCTARYRLGARRVVDGDYEAALDQFLEIIRRNPNFDDGAGRRALLAVFEILGKDNSLVGTYRRKLAAQLH